MPAESERAPQTTVDALMYCLRGQGIAALNEFKNLDRLASMSSDQIREVIARLKRLRPDYPAITDELLSLLEAQA